MTNKGLGAIKTRAEWMALVKQAAEDYTGTLWREDGGYIIEEEKGYSINVYDYLDEHVGSLIEEEKQRLKEE